jgi:hypothetical protein
LLFLVHPCESAFLIWSHVRSASSAKRRKNTPREWRIDLNRVQRKTAWAALTEVERIAFCETLAAERAEIRDVRKLKSTWLLETPGRTEAGWEALLHTDKLAAARAMANSAPDLSLPAPPPLPLPTDAGFRMVLQSKAKRRNNTDPAGSSALNVTRGVGAPHPGVDVVSDDGLPDVSSSKRTLADQFADGETAAPAPEAKKRVFECDICKARFGLAKHMKVHRRFHTGEKPFPCTGCGNFFVSASALKVHMRSHTGERPFVCNFCPRAFAQTSNRAVHMRMHTGEKPYRCDECGKIFAESGTLNKHLELHRRGPAVSKTIIGVLPKPACTGDSPAKKEPT